MPEFDWPSGTGTEKRVMALWRRSKVIPEESLFEIGWGVYPNMFQAPALALSMWSPLWVEPCKWNSQAYGSFGAIASEWQRFANGRLREDFVLIERVAQSRSPEQIWAAYVDFWHRAVEDYGKEYMSLGRLVASVTSKSVGAAQSAIA
jgi:hypothetical protein